MIIQELADKHHNDFPGYKLVDFYEAAFPAHVMQLKVVVQVQRPIPIIDEFVLKAIDAEQVSIEEISGLLGLESDVVRNTIDHLEREEFLTVTHVAGLNRIHIKMTARGSNALRELIVTEPERTNMTVYMDALTSQIYPSRPLRQPKDVRDIYHIIPTFISKPSIVDLQKDFFLLKRIYVERERPESTLLHDRYMRLPKRELIDVTDVDKTWVAYRIMRVLQFIRPDDGDLQVEVYDGVERTNIHEAVLLRMEEDKFRPLRTTSSDQVPDRAASISEIPEAILRVAPLVEFKTAEIPRLQKEIEAKHSLIQEESLRLESDIVVERQEAVYIIEQLRRDIEAAEEKIHGLENSSGDVVALQMHEHRQKLIDAFKFATKYVIVISPWLTPDAVDGELTNIIGASLSRGVTIFIGHGLGPEKPAEKLTLNDLNTVAKGKKGHLVIQRFGDVHSKVLIYDQSQIILTSFNWLSFAGDPKRGSRVEDGFLTTNKQIILQKTTEWLGRFDRNEARALMNLLNKPK